MTTNIEIECLSSIGIAAIVYLSCSDIERECLYEIEKAEKEWIRSLDQLLLPVQWQKPQQQGSSNLGLGLEYHIGGIGGIR